MHTATTIPSTLHDQMITNARQCTFNRLWIDLDEHTPEWDAQIRQLFQRMQPHDADIFEGFRVFTAGAFTVALDEADEEIWHYNAPLDATWDLKGESAYMVARMGLFVFLHEVLAPLRRGESSDWDLYLTSYESVYNFEALMGWLCDEMAEAAHNDKYFSLHAEVV